MMLADNGTVLEETHYYPFGLTMNDIGSTNTAVSLENKYLYNGKELQSELGLDQYDYGARFYDPQIGRWHVPDPLASLYKRHTPYAYVLNNPILLTDPYGMRADTSIVSTVLETVLVLAVRTTPWWNSFSIPIMSPIKAPNPGSLLILALLLPSNWNQKPYVEVSISPEAQQQMFKRYEEQMDEKEKKEEEVEKKERSEKETTPEKERSEKEAAREKEWPQDKELSDGEIQKLKDAGEDIHDLKGGKSASRKDLFKDKKGNIYVKPKGGKGPGESLNININNY
ncbi:polymorphic toxin type 33 domain-containing protein [Niabella sp. 22666]|uniref:polymorphic toxin type 33 domain-containing protein n=1 Tax=Niabella sp. 22666 TaxID=3453954 RepID=UPI003F8342B3